MAQTQAQMIDQPGLSYGLFHLAVKPNKLYGIVTTGITFQGLNLDVGHMRYLRWSKTNDKPAWIAYNRMRGQQASALEHATPEAFWIDRTKCRYTDENGNIQNPSLTDCPQAVSAVKAIAIAASQGQKIYTITQKNAAVALPKLSLSRGVAEEIQNAVASGKEVTVHEKAINAYGFSGFGYTIIDPDTGVGAYLIEGKGSGGLVILLAFIGTLLILAGIVLALTPATIPLAIALFALGVFFLSWSIALVRMPGSDATWNDFWLGVGAGFAVAGGILALSSVTTIVGVTVFTSNTIAQIIALAGLILVLKDLLIRMLSEVIYLEHKRLAYLEGSFFISINIFNSLRTA